MGKSQWTLKDNWVEIASSQRKEQENTYLQSILCSKIFFGVIQATCRNYSNNFQLRKLEISAIRALSTFIWEVLLKSPYFCSSKLDCVKLPLTSSLFSKVGLSKSKAKKSCLTETPRFFSHLGNWLLMIFAIATRDCGGENTIVHYFWLLPP